jgi:hypothetical protein
VCSRTVISKVQTWVHASQPWGLCMAFKSAIELPPHPTLLFTSFLSSQTELCKVPSKNQANSCLYFSSHYCHCLDCCSPLCLSSNHLFIFQKNIYWSYQIAQASCPLWNIFSSVQVELITSSVAPLLYLVKCPPFHFIFIFLYTCFLTWT